MKKIVAYTFALCIALGMVSFAVALPPGGGPVGGGIIPGGPLTATTMTVTTLNESNATAVDTYSDGVTLSNTTAATNGHNAYGPSINLHGHGFKTNPTAASVGTDWRITNEPVNGAAAPTTNLTFRSSAADTPSYTERMKLGSDGTLTLTAVPTLPTQTANYMFAGPTTGSATAPTFRALVDADVPNTITIDLASAATALANDPADCAANQFANAIAASGALTCAAIADADVPDTITVSNYCALAGCTMTAALANTTTNTATSGGINSAAITGTDLSSVVVTAGDANYLGLYGVATKTGACTSVGTISTIGVSGVASQTGSTVAGTRDTMGGYFSATGDAAGTSTAYGVYATATGADTNYAGYFAGDTFNAGHLLFTDNTYDIGASGATRPRTGYFGTDVVVGGDVVVTDDVTCNQATATVDAITALTAPSVTTAVASDGILLRNTTNSGTSQLFSPSLRLDGTGYTAGPTLARHSWVVTNKPMSATLGYLSLDWSTGGGAYTETARFYSSGFVSFNSGYIQLTSGNYGRGLYSAAYPMVLETQLANAATTVSTYISSTAALTVEGARLLKITNGTVGASNTSVDKDGVFHQGYVSTTTTAAGTSAVTMVSAVDDDSIYRIRFVCEGIQVAATPAFYAGYTITQYVSRIDGTITERGETLNDSYESAAGCDCTVGVTDSTVDLITATATGCDAAAGTMQWKIWIESMQKVNGTAFTPVAQPAAN